MKSYPRKHFIFDDNIALVSAESLGFTAETKPASFRIEGEGMIPDVEVALYDYNDGAIEYVEVDPKTNVFGDRAVIVVTAVRNWRNRKGEEKLDLLISP